MRDYKKSTEHLTNAALASPLAFLAGGPAGMIATLGLGKLIDTLDDRDFEKRRAEWAATHPSVPKPTLEEVQRQYAVNSEYRQMINNLQEFRNGNKISACANWKYGHEKEIYITVIGGQTAQDPPPATVDGEVIFHMGIHDYVGSKRVPAKLYRYEKDFYEIFSRDKNRYPDIKTYKITASSYKKGTWMYTVDGGKSFVVGL